MNPRPIPWTAAVLAGLWLATAAAAGAAPRPAYAIGKVTIVGGNPIQGIGDVLFEQRFDSRCKLPAPGGMKPLSVALTPSAWLDVQIIACGGEAPTPQVSCQLQVGDASLHRAFRGWEQLLPIPLPDATGLHSLTLACSLPGPPAPPLVAKLYLTYRRPACTVARTGKAPREEWYDRAVDWGSGLKVSTPEPDVARLLLRGIYSHGQRNWRYGYCRLGGKKCDECFFPPDTSAVDTSSLTCNKAGCGAICKCSWEQLLTEKSCNFGDCFVFTNLLSYMSAVMGVGGLTFIEPKGSNQKGFVTQPALRSLDPKFPGNALCGPDLAGCAYLFGNHALLSRDGTVYDTTFGQTYSGLQGLINQNVQNVVGSTPNLKLEKSFACFLKKGYGTWAFYRLQSEACGTGFAELAEPSEVPTFSSFRNVPAILGEVLGSWLRPRESLFGAELAIDVREGEKYVLESRLRTIGGEVLAYECQEIMLTAGTSSIRVELSSPVIGETGYNGPYVGDFVLYRADPPEVLNSTTAYFQFGPDDEAGPAKTP